MKNTTSKIQSHTPILSIFFFILLFISFRLVAQVGDVLVIDSTKVQVNTSLEVNGRIKDKTGMVMPVGSIIAFAGKKAPEGWLLCDGSSYKKKDYRELFEVIGDTSESKEEEFKVPDLRQTFIMGAGDNDSVSVRRNGGPDQHSHEVKVPIDTFRTEITGEHTHLFNEKWKTQMIAEQKNGGTIESGFINVGKDNITQPFKKMSTSNAGSHSHSVKIEIPKFPTETHIGPNRPKWQALNYIIKY